MPNKLSQFWQELKRRKVIHVVVVYASAAFVIIELVNNIWETLNLPAWTPALTLIILIIGFPMAVIFTWIYGLSSDSTRIGVTIPEGRSFKFENSIAVLPFQDMSPERDQEYFCDGIAEEIINTLAHVTNLKVIARTSAFAFKNRNIDMREIGEKLNVETLLEGSIRKSNSKLRITAQLIRADNGLHIWSERFDRDLDDVFAIQDEISLAIVEHLKTGLPKTEKRSLVKHTVENPEPYDLYLQGRFNTNMRNTESLKKAIDIYQEAIQLEPTYALAYAGLSEAYTLSGIGYGSVPLKEAFPKAKEAALRAIELNDELCEAHTSLAFAKQYFEFDWPVIEQEWKRAIELNPGYAPAHQWYGEYLFIMKRWEESEKEIRLALELDPLSSIIQTELGWLFHYQNQVDRAIEQYQKVIDTTPDYAVVHFNLGIAYNTKKMYQQAIEESEKAVDLSGGSPFMKAGLAYAYAQSGDVASAIKIRDELLNLANSGQLLHGPLVTVYVGLKEKEEAMKCLEIAFRNKENYSFLARAWYENYLGSYLLSNEPRFSQIQREIGLE